MFKPGLNDYQTSNWIDFNTDVELTLTDQGMTISGQSENLSIAGLIMQPLPPEQYFEAGLACSVKIVLRGEKSNLIIDDLGGEIVSCDERGVGIRFTGRLEWYALFHIFDRKINKMMTFDL